MFRTWPLAVLRVDASGVPASRIMGLEQVPDSAHGGWRVASPLCIRRETMRACVVFSARSTANDAFEDQSAYGGVGESRFRAVDLHHLFAKRLDSRQMLFRRRRNAARLG